MQAHHLQRLSWDDVVSSFHSYVHTTRPLTAASIAAPAQPIADTTTECGHGVKRSFPVVAATMLRIVTPALFCDSKMALSRAPPSDPWLHWNPASRNPAHLVRSFPDTLLRNCFMESDDRQMLICNNQRGFAAARCTCQLTGKSSARTSSHGCVFFKLSTLLPDRIQRRGSHLNPRHRPSPNRSTVLVCSCRSSPDRTIRRCHTRRCGRK